MTAFQTFAIPHYAILLDCPVMNGFLADRERVQDEVEKAAEQGRLFE